jgi:hypothetical protein
LKQAHVDLQLNVERTELNIDVQRSAVPIRINIEVDAVVTLIEIDIGRAVVPISVAVIRAIVPTVMAVVTSFFPAVMVGPVVLSFPWRVSVTLVVVCSLPVGIPPTVAFVLPRRIMVMAAIVPGRSRPCHWSVPAIPVHLRQDSGLSGVGNVRNEL